MLTPEKSIFFIFGIPCLKKRRTLKKGQIQIPLISDSDPTSSSPLPLITHHVNPVVRDATDHPTGP